MYGNSEEVPENAILEKGIPEEFPSIPDLGIPGLGIPPHYRKPQKGPTDHFWCRNFLFATPSPQNGGCFAAAL